MRSQSTSVTMHWPHIGLADKMVSDERLPDGEGNTLPSLREEVATPEGLCYIRVVRPFHDGTYLARIAASLDLLEQDPATIVLTEAHLRYTLPLDTRMEELCPARLCALLHSHATAVQPATKCAPEQSVRSQSVPAVALELLGEVITVSTDTLEDIFTPIVAPSGSQPDAPADRFRIQQILLSVALRSVKKALMCAHASQVPDLKARYALLEQVKQWQRQTRQRVVNMARGFDSRGRLGWQIMIGIPETVQPSAVAV